MQFNKNKLSNQEFLKKIPLKTNEETKKIAKTEFKIKNKLSNRFPKSITKSNPKFMHKKKANHSATLLIKNEILKNPNLLES